MNPVLHVPASCISNAHLPMPLNKHPRRKAEYPDSPCRRPGYPYVALRDAKQDIPTSYIESSRRQWSPIHRGLCNRSHRVPSRMSLITGRRSAQSGSDRRRHGAGTESGLSLNETTLADRLRASGYTSIALGKWHSRELKNSSPRGIRRVLRDPQACTITSKMRTRTGDRSWTADSPAVDGSYGRAADAEFIQRRQKSGAPWFTDLAFNAVHTPMQAREDKLKQFSGIADEKRRTHAAMVGRCRGTGFGCCLERRGGRKYADLFLSDNGGPLPVMLDKRRAEHATERFQAGGMGGRRAGAVLHAMENAIRPGLLSWMVVS